MLLSSLPARLTSVTVLHCHLGSALRSRDQCVPMNLLCAHLCHIYLHASFLAGLVWHKRDSAVLTLAVL